MNLMEWCTEREMVAPPSCEKQMYWRHLSEWTAEVLPTSAHSEMSAHLPWMVYLLVESLLTMGVLHSNTVHFELTEVQRYTMVVRDD